MLVDVHAYLLSTSLHSPMYVYIHSQSSYVESGITGLVITGSCTNAESNYKVESSVDNLYSYCQGRS